jgi:hypothetical protein
MQAVLFAGIKRRLRKKHFLLSNCFASAIAFFFLFADTATGQTEEDAGWRISAGVSGSYTVLKEDHFSRQTLTGYAPAYQLTLSYSGKNSVHELGLFYSKDILRNDLIPAFSAEQNYVRVIYSNMYTITGNTEKAFLLRIGPGLSGLIARRTYKELINNNESFETAVSLHAAAEAHYRIG